MGCFSYMCKECGKAVLSNSSTGQEVKLFLLHDGKVLQEMEGQYDSYGRVFIKGTQVESVQHHLQQSVHWDNPFPDVPPNENEQYFIDKGYGMDYWSRVCDLLFNKNDSDGIAAVHTKCFTTVPTTRSEDDPMQGWGEEGELMGDCDPDAELD